MREQVADGGEQAEEGKKQGTGGRRSSPQPPHNVKVDDDFHTGPSCGTEVAGCRLLQVTGCTEVAGCRLPQVTSCTEVAGCRLIL